MLGFAGRGCARSCLGCLLPLLVIAALLLLLVHQITTPPSYPAVRPASPAALELAVAKGRTAALNTQQKVALVELNDAEATTLLRESISGTTALSDLEVHILSGKVVVTGQTDLLSHPLVVSGTVQLKSGGGSAVDLDFQGVWIGQLGLPGLVAKVLSHSLHPQFDLSLAAADADARFACSSAYRDNLVVGVEFGSAADPGAPQACAGVS